MINSVEMQRGLKWLIAFRIIFSIILIFSTLVFSTNESLPFDARPFVAVYMLALLMLVISVVYGLMFKRFSSRPLFAYLQLTIDSFAVSCIIYITGGFQSIFTFIYLVVIIAASMLLFRKGSLIIATLCSLQYGVLIDLEYYGFISPLVTKGTLSAQVEWNHVIYRLVIMMTSCFAVAVLSGFLSLQAKMARRDLKLMEDHLNRVKKMAAMGEIAAGMAHEIKNPLASLSGSIQMMKEDSEPGTNNYKLMQIVLRETERLTRIVTEFLLFAKPPAINAKKIQLAPEIVETIKLFKQDALCRNALSDDADDTKLCPNALSDYADDAELCCNALSDYADDAEFCCNVLSDYDDDLCRDDLRSDDAVCSHSMAEDTGFCSNKIEFQMNLDESLAVNIDPDHFRQIMWNLVKNAAEAINIRRNNDVEETLHESTGSGLIVIRLFKSKDGRILLKVSDNGCGIEQKYLDSVFNPFFTTKSYGTGLGLSIIHRLVDSYNGLIYAESTYGKGTTFTVIFKEDAGISLF
ncbi:MAG: two-component sensor histidine kinase [Desulfamplus sp.]|nr:two-component sensor histidine kinase [Desulfamplus sp.]